MTSKKIGLYLGIGILYFILALPFAGLHFSDGYSEIRFTSLLPMAAGLLCGFPGALSCALGNLLGDLCTGPDIYCIFGFAGNFLMAWLPYKLWHTLFFAGRQGPRYLESSGSILKFVAVSLIASCASVGVIGAGGQLLSGFSFGAFFLPVALQYYDLSLLGGMLLFQICLTVFRMTPHIPWQAYRRIRRERDYLPDYLLSGLVVAVACALTALTMGQGQEIRQSPLITGLCLLLLAASLVLACLPVGRGKEETETESRYLPPVGVRAQFVTLFLLILCMILIALTAVCLRLLYVDFAAFTQGAGNTSLLWLRVIVAAAVIGTFFIIVLPLLLKGILRVVAEPVEKTANYARQFAAGETLTEESLVIGRTGNELDGLGQSINTMAGNIRAFVEETRLRAIKEEKLAAELNIARNIQQGLLPERWTGSGFDIVPFIKPAREVGGDFYHFSRLDEDRVFVCIADVSGKDISAAMFMVQAKILMEEGCSLPPDQMMARVNNALSKSNKAMMFVTAFAAIVDRKNRRMTYANAGHNPPICQNNGRICWLDEEADFVLGPMENTHYQQHTMDLADDFMLFIYTDGVNEAENSDGEFFGNHRLFEEAGRQLREGSGCQGLVENLAARLETFTEGAQQSDDITMLALSMK